MSVLQYKQPSRGWHCHYRPATLKMGGGTDSNREEELEPEVRGEKMFLKQISCIRKRKLP